MFVWLLRNVGVGLVLAEVLVLDSGAWVLDGAGEVDDLGASGGVS